MAGAFPHPSDRRTTLATLTATGRGIMEDATRAVVEARIGLTELTARDAVDLHRILRKLRIGSGDFDSTG